MTAAELNQLAQRLLAESVKALNCLCIKSPPCDYHEGFEDGMYALIDAITMEAKPLP